MTSYTGLMVDGFTLEDTRFYVEVNDPTKPVELLYGPAILDITHEMWEVDEALPELDMGDIAADETAAMVAFHQDYIEEEDVDAIQEFISEEMDADYDNNQGWLNANGYYTLLHMYSVVKASSYDPRMKGLEEYGPVHEHCRMYNHPTHGCTNEFVTVVYVRSIGHKYGTAYCRWGPIHVPGAILHWYRGYLKEGMKVPMVISYSPPEDENHKPFRAKIGIDINLGNVPRTSGSGIYCLLYTSPRPRD